MKKNIFVLYFVPFIFFNCGNNSTKNKAQRGNIDENNDSLKSELVEDLKADSNFKDKETMDIYLASEKKEIECLSKVLNSYSYKVDKNTFKTKLQQYLNLSLIQKQNNEDLYTSVIVNNSYTEFSFFEDGCYVKLGTELLPEEQLDPKKMIEWAAEDGTYMRDFVSINNVLFNNDKNAEAYLIRNNSDLVKDLVVLFNYEQNDDMIICAIDNLSAKGYPNYYNECMIFYNNRAEIRTSFLNKIAHYDPLLVKYLYGFLSLNKKDIKESTKKDDDIINTAIVTLKNIQSKYARYAIIEDPDGYSNLRKEGNTSSAIVQEIKTGEDVGIISYNENWVLVKTKEGNQGYVHKSRVREK